MVDEKISKLREAFQRSIAAVLAPFPELALDGSWPSVGTIDLLTYHLRGKRDFDDADSALVQGCAAYLSEIAFHIWRSFPNVSGVTLQCSSDSLSDITLTAQIGAPDSVASEYRVSITRLLLDVLQWEERELPIFESFSTALLPEENRISRVMTGLLTGLCPWGEGLWKGKRLYELTPQLMIAQEILAESSREFYRRAYPMEQLGQNPELYCANLILPPSGFDEAAPLCRAVTGVLHYLIEQNQLTDEFRLEGKLSRGNGPLELVRNLALSPDQLISDAGFILLAAFEGERPSPTALALADSKRNRAPLFRPALLTARKILERPYDWVLSLDDGLIDEAKQLATCEQRLGLLPLLQGGTDLFQLKLANGLLQSIAWNRADIARHNALHILRTAEIHPAVALQGLYLDLVCGEIDQALLGLAALGQQIGAADPLRYRVAEVEALGRLAKNDSQGACAQYDLACALVPELAEDRARVFNGSAWALILSGNFPRALAQLDLAIRACPYNITARLNRIHVLCQLSREDEARVEVNNVARYNAADRRVFDYIRRGFY